MREQISFTKNDPVIKMKPYNLKHTILLKIFKILKDCLQSRTYIQTGTHFWQKEDHSLHLNRKNRGKNGLIFRQILSRKISVLIPSVYIQDMIKIHIYLDPISLFSVFLFLFFYSNHQYILPSLFLFYVC
jgi:hypothetical protein